MNARIFQSLSALTLCVAGSSSAWSAEVVKGQIFPAGQPEEKAVFKYENTRIKAGEEVVSSKTRYLDTEGKLLVEEDVFYEGGKLRRYRYNQLQTDERGEIEIRNRKVHFTYFSQGKKQTDQEDLEEMTIVPDMIGDVLRSSWKQLSAGESVKVRFLLLERLDSVGFKFFVEKERDFAGKRAVDIVMKASSIFIAALAPKIIITMEKDYPHRLLETNGRLPVRMPKVNPPKSRKDWKAIDGRLVLEYSN